MFVCLGNKGQNDQCRNLESFCEREREREPRLDSMGNGCFSYFSYDCKIASPMIDIYLVHFGFAEIRA